MAFVERIRIFEVWKKEASISKILKLQKGRKLENVELDNNELVLKFSDTKNSKTKTVVKQFSKQKHEDVNICVSNFLRSKCHCLGWSEWKIIKIIEFPDMWLAFLERKL